MAFPDQDNHAVVAALVEMHRHPADQGSVDDVLNRVAIGARASVRGSDTAAVTVYREGAYRTAAMVGEPAQPLDDAQYESDTGPCLDAHRHNRLVEVPDMDRASRWPEFRKAALGLDFHSSLSLPLSVQGQSLGAINIYSRQRAPFDPEVNAVAATFARDASVAVANVMVVRRLQDLVDQLTEALESRDVLGQAKGILMTQRRVTADEAFEVLRARSQQLNRKVRDLARDFVETGDLDAVERRR